MFTIKNLKYKQILDIESLVLDREVNCIVGSSGSGKTTLLRHLNRLAEPDEGEILYDGTPLRQIPPVQLRRQVVMLGQTPVLYRGTVADNLQAGLRFSQKFAASTKRMQEALAQVNLEKPLDSYCDRLSGGERQRLCLARVLLMDADCYLLDEPSAALDRENEGFMIRNMADFVRREKKQLILVSHSEQVAAMFPDGIVRLEHGRVTGGGIRTEKDGGAGRGASAGRAEDAKQAEHPEDAECGRQEGCPEDAERGRQEGCPEDAERGRQEGCPEDAERGRQEKRPERAACLSKDGALGEEVRP